MIFKNYESETLSAATEVQNTLSRSNAQQSTKLKMLVVKFRAVNFGFLILRHIGILGIKSNMLSETKVH